MANWKGVVVAFDTTRLRKTELQTAIGILLSERDVVGRHFIRSLLPKSAYVTGKRDPVSKRLSNALNAFEKAGFVHRNRFTVEVLDREGILKAVKDSLATPIAASFAHETLSQWDKKHSKSPLWYEFQRQVGTLSL